MSLSQDPAAPDIGREAIAAPRPGGRALLRGLASRNMIQPIGVVFVRGFEVAAKFGFQIAVARCLSREAAGVFLLALSIMSVLQTVATAGIGRALVLYVARAERDLGRKGVFAVASAGLWPMLVFASGVGVATVALAGPAATFIFHKPDLVGPLQWIAGGLVAYALLTGVAGVLTAMGAAVIGDFLRSSFWPALTAVLLLMSDHTAATAAMLTTLSTALATLIAWVMMRIMAPSRWPRLGELKPPRGLIETAIPLGMVDVIGVILVSAPTLFLGALAPAAQVAVFSVANRMANVFITVVSAIGNASSPRFAMLADAGDPKPLGRAVSQVALLSAVVCLPPILLLAAFPDHAMALFGPGYRSGGAVLRVLMLGDAVFVGFACCSELLAMAGAGKLLRQLNLMLLAACLGFSALLIPWFGAIGAASAMALTMSLNGVLVGYGVWRKLKLRPVPLLAGLA
jgi:O-antigen/teichoic acid export membrane protein